MPGRDSSMSVPDLWYRVVAAVLTQTYYRRVHVTRLGVVPAQGPVLCVALHRNGAVDGMVYKRVVPRATFLVSVQLLRNPLGRLFFTGIPVTRAKDRGARADGPGNAEALDASVEHLRGGGVLCVMPEGTSDLGPRHLPFHSGAARILDRALSVGIRPAVVPLGIFYRAPEAFRSDIVVVVGQAIEIDGVSEDRVDALMARITDALEQLGVNVDSAETLARVERTAAMRAGDDLSAYYAALKTGDAGADEDWRLIESAAVATERGVPVVSTRGVAWSAAWLVVQAPLVALAAVVNVVPLLAAGIAGAMLADARNTVALWRILVGAPVAVLWVVLWGIVAGATGRPALFVAYVLITALGLVVYPELLARWPRLVNARLAPDVRAAIGRLRGE
jgi:1-acyl-sn-glycerol-3-phosphate acyltransferase